MHQIPDCQWFIFHTRGVHRSICRDLLILFSTELNIKIDCLFFSPNEHCTNCPTAASLKAIFLLIFVPVRLIAFCNELIVLSYYPCGNISLFEEMIDTIFRDFWVPIEALKAFSMAHGRLATGKMAHLASQCFSGVQSEWYWICGFLEIIIELSLMGNQNSLHANFLIQIRMTLLKS